MTNIFLFLHNLTNQPGCHKKTATPANYYKTKSCHVPVVAVSFPKLVLVVKEDEIQRPMKIKIGGPLRCLFVSLQQPATSPIELAITSSPIKTDCSQLNTNHIIDYNTLSKFLKEDMYCKSCVNKFVKEYCKQSLRDFVTQLLYIKQTTKAVH